MTKHIDDQTGTRGSALLDDDRAFLRWCQADKAMAGLGTIGHLERSARKDATSREASALLTKAAAIGIADDGSDLSPRVLTDAFSPSIWEVADALSAFSGEPYEACMTIASGELASVLHEAVFFGEPIAGATVTSRLWARSVAAVTGRGTISSEALAAFLRSRTAVGSFRQAMKKRSARDRLTTRLAPVIRVSTIYNSCKAKGTSFERACRTRRIPLRVARRQVKLWQSRREAYVAEMTALTATLDWAEDETSPIGGAAGR
jgi:hypothetical protein